MEKERQWEAELAGLMEQSSVAESKSDNQKEDECSKTEEVTSPSSANSMVQESKA